MMSRRSSITSRWPALLGGGWLLVLALLISCPSARADETVQVCGSFANNLFAASTVSGITTTGQCPAPSYNGGGFGLFNSRTTSRGQTGRWQTVAPAGLELVGATANQIVSAGVNAGGDYGGGFYWSSGGSQTNAQTPSSLGMIFASPSSYFGMQLVCGKNSCTAPAQLDVGAFSLYARETSGPGFNAPSGLWQTGGWIRGTWPFVTSGDSPSGLCTLSAALDGQLIDTTTSPRDVSTWHQCAAPAISQPVDTTRYGQGAVPLTLSASDAAAVPASLTKTVYIDNSTPTVSLSGPVDAPSTAGTQYVTATAGGSPSRIAQIVCSVDGGPEGLPDIRPDGRFLILWKFVAGRGVIHPWFSVGTLPEAAFPYAPGTSKHMVVTLGKRTPLLVRHRHRKRHPKVKRHTGAKKR